MAGFLKCLNAIGLDVNRQETAYLEVLRRQFSDRFFISGLLKQVLSLPSAANNFRFFENNFLKV